MYGTGSAHYTRAYIETGHKESFLSFFPSLVHSSILHLPFVSPFLFAHFHFYARHYSLSHSHPVFYSLSHSHFSTFSPFASFEHRCSPSLAFPRSFILVSLSIVSTVLYTVSVPCLAFSFHLLTSPPIANHVRSRSLPHFSSVRSRSLVNPKQQVPTLLAALRVHLLNRFLSLVCCWRDAASDTLLASGEVSTFRKIQTERFRWRVELSIVLDCIFRRDSRSSIRISLFQPLVLLSFHV